MYGFRFLGHTALPYRNLNAPLQPWALRYAATSPTSHVKAKGQVSDRKAVPETEMCLVL